MFCSKELLEQLKQKLKTMHLRPIKLGPDNPFDPDSELGKIILSPTKIEIERE